MYFAESQGCFECLNTDYFVLQLRLVSLISINKGIKFDSYSWFEIFRLKIKGNFPDF